MSPTGSPDFSQNPSSNLSSPSFDSGEDTTRLLMGGGSQARGGRWIWATGFENGLSEIIRTLGGGTITLETGLDSVYQGAASLKLLTNNVTNAQTYLTKTIFSQGERYGFEMVFSSIGLATNPREYAFEITGPTATSGQRAQGKVVLVVNGAFNGALYTDVGGSRTLIRDVSDYLEDNNQCYHYAKLVFDVNKNILIRFYFDDLIFDLGNTPGYQFGGQTRINIFMASVKTLGAFATNMYIDNVVITVDEP